MLYDRLLRHQLHFDSIGILKVDGVGGVRWFGRGLIYSKSVQILAHPGQYFGEGGAALEVETGASVVFPFKESSIIRVREFQGIAG